MIRIVMLVVVLGLAIPAITVAQTCNNIQTFQVTPEVPRERESFTIAAGGDWCVNVANKFSAVEITDNTITFHVTITGGILNVVTPWNATANLENIRHGKYTVNVRLYSSSSGLVAQESYPLDIKGGKGKP